MKFNRLPSYPLFVKDPFFSLWSDSDELNAKNTVFWHGEEKPMYGTVEALGKEYSFMGVKDGAIPLKQRDRRITVFSTEYDFENELFTITVKFVSPLLPTDIVTASCPVCYLQYDLKPKVALDDVIVKLSVEERVCYDTCSTYNNQNVNEPRPVTNENSFKPVRLGVLKNNKYETAFMGLRRQMPLSHAYDEVGADWGYYYVVGEKATNDIFGKRKFITAYNVHNGNYQGCLYLAFDDTLSIYYFGEWLKGYFFKDGKNIFDAIDYSIDNQGKIFADCSDFENQLKKDIAPYGEEYEYLLNASIRQTMGAHKIVRDGKGRVLFLSKECNSDGCIATVDISYPTFPILYKYNKTLLEGSLYPIFDFARMPVWEEDFAPHDAGVYPYCLGQLYAVKNEKDKDYAYGLNGENESLPEYYLFPKGNEIYNFEKQMPVEESANMIILTALTKNKALMQENYDLLTKWVKYLVEKGLIPDNQLCTDDFAGHLDKNANLAIKAIMGIKAYAEINKELGDDDLYKKYFDIARNYAKKWFELYVVDGTSVLNLGNENSFSLKYNLAIDTLIGREIFPKDFKEREVDLYLSKANRYGTPLDSRKDYTKADWLLWAASLSRDIEKRKAMIKPICNFLAETKNRVPFSDWYETVDGTYQLFRNRTVLGGLFMCLIN